jgi:hypothetical protein
VTTPMVLVASWRDGLFVVAGENLNQELRNRSVGALAPDGRGGTLAIVDGRSVRRRAPNGVWSMIAATEFDLACCVAVGDVIYVGTDDARVLRVGAGGELQQLRGFDAVAGSPLDSEARFERLRGSCMARVAVLALGGSR